MLSHIKHCFSKILRWFHSKTVAAHRVESNVDIEKHPWTFEVSWDVVGNVADMVTINGYKNILVGPYRPDRVVNEVVESELPPGTALAMAVHSIREKGLHVVTGKWLVEGQPPAILFDIRSAKNTFDHIERFKKEQGIEIPDNDQESKDAVVFGCMVAEFLTEFELKRSESDATPTPRDETCAVFHDWNCGVALILLHQCQSPVVTVFTLKTSQLQGHFESEKRAADKAKALGIYHRLCIERGAAFATDMFSCVSEIVAEQVELILDKHPDCVILPTVKT